MSYVIVDAADIPAGRGPHPAASPFDRRISEALGVSAFEIYRVDLPSGAETLSDNHIDDRNEDVYAIVAGDGWVVIDDEPHPIGPGIFVSVSIESTRYLRAGDNGISFIAVCEEP